MAGPLRNRLPDPSPRGLDDSLTPTRRAPTVDPLVPSRSKLLLYGLATLSGVLYFVSFIGFDQWYLAWFALAPLLVALRSVERGRRALWVSWWMGLVTHLGGYYWVVHLLRTFAYLPLPLAVLGYALLCLAQSGVLALFGWLAWLLHRRLRMPLGWAAPVALMAAELVYPLIFQSYTANSQAWVPRLTGVLDLGGPLLLSGMIALAGGAVAEIIAALVERRRPPIALPAVALLAVLFDLGYSAKRSGQMDARDAAAPKLKTAIIQANIGAADKHLQSAAGIRRFRDMTDQALATPGLGLVVWPESGFNRLVVGHPNLEGQVATAVKVPMIVGVLRGEQAGQKLNVWNSAVAVEPGGAVGDHYDKVQLLIFGEYVPFEKELHRLYEKILPYTSTYQRGTTFRPLKVGDYRLSADICYEDILPGHIRALMAAVDPGEPRPDAMVNVTNDSWYGPAEPPIHLALSTFRSVEHRRWLIRSTATGISAFVDSSGRLVQKSDFERAQVLVQDVPMIKGRPTIYAQIGDLVGWVSLAMCVGALLFKRAPKAEAPQGPRGRAA
jgi:apolipoprotein N-acyltransferase